MTLATYLGVPFNFWWKDLDSVGLRVSIPELPSNYCLPAGSRFSASRLKIYCWYLPSRASPVWGSLIFEGTRCKEVPWPKLLVIVENDHFVSLRMLSVKNPVLNHIKPLFLVGCSFGKGCLGWPMTHDWKWVNHDFETHDMPTKMSITLYQVAFPPRHHEFSHGVEQMMAATGVLEPGWYNLTSIWRLQPKFFMVYSAISTKQKQPCCHAGFNKDY